MIATIRELFQYRELMVTLAWKNIAVRYKQAYLGIVWAVLKPVMLMLIFTVVRSFIGIDSGPIPYPILTFAALMPWVFFQESTSDAVPSVVYNAMLVKKIYFPRAIFPITSVMTKLVELGINFIILAALMLWYGFFPTAHVLWLPVIIFYTILVCLTVSMAGAAMNVYYRDITSALPIMISLLMYASPVIYPFSLVEHTLLVKQAAGGWSDIFYFLYRMNPMAGIIDAFQKVLLYGVAPDISVIWPGLLLTVVFLPLSYMYFRRAETYFADVI